LAATETREVRAQAKWVRTSARKARLVAEHIRGRNVRDAQAVLAFTPRAAAREMEKVLRSAVANAEANHGLVGDDLVVHAAFVDEGPTLKRWRARARGRAARIRKRTCHITVLLVPAAPEALEKSGRRPRQRAGSQVAETPKRRLPAPRRAKKQAEPAAPAETEPAAVAEEAPSAESPKARPRKKKTEEGGS
jgi:ribosomal protein L22